MSIININYKKRYSFGEMIDKISEDSTLSFISNGKLYFKKNDEFKTCDFKDNIENGAPYGEDVIITSELMKQSFYETDIYISEIITQIQIEEVREHLLEEKPIMLTVGDNSWIIELEDDVVYLDYTQVKHADDDNYMELFTCDILEGLINSMWHVIEKDNFNKNRVLH